MDEYQTYQVEIMQDIVEECQEYATNWQRSEDEGWLYPDGDEE